MQTVNINGTEYTDLVAQWRKAQDAYLKLANAMAEATPHGRDFIPQGGDAFRAAYAEHMRICRMLGEVYQYIDTNFSNIITQVED
jgi:hypothetical protein